MTLRGAAFLALWNDFDPARDDEYSVWHTFEHVPERVGIEGFICGRRYVARERTEQRYFTLYEIESLAALDGPSYQDVVDRPTEWSAAMRPSFRNFLRSPCATILSAGLGLAGAILTFRFGTSRESAATMATVALETLLETSGITAVHLGRVDATGKFPLGNAPQPGYVLVVEGLYRRELEATAPPILAALALLQPIEPIAWKGYDLAVALERSGLKYPVTARQPPRPDLRGRWK